MLIFLVVALFLLVNLTFFQLFAGLPNLILNLLGMGLGYAAIAMVIILFSWGFGE